jgi:hypothetical protein
MIKYIFTFALIFIAQNSLFSQTKSKQYTPKKTVSKPSTIKKAAPITKKAIIKPIPNLLKDTTKAPTNKTVIDSTKIVKPKVVPETKQKPITGPISGPIGDGPSSYSGKTKKTDEKAVAAKKSQAKLKSKTKKHLVTNWIKNNLDLGIRFGANYSTINNFAELVFSGTNIPTEKPLSGFTGGFIFNVKSLKNIKFQPEILISQQGSQIIEPMNQYKFRITYLKVPLLLKKNFGTKNLNYFVTAGGYFGYAISKKSEREIGGKIFTDKLEFETKYDVFGKKDNRFDYGPVIGAGVNYKLQKATISFDTRYDHGLSDLILYKGEHINATKNIGQNRVLSASIGLLYSF